MNTVLDSLVPEFEAEEQAQRGSCWFCTNVTTRLTDTRPVITPNKFERYLAARPEKRREGYECHVTAFR